MLEVISYRLQHPIDDNVLEDAWDVIANVIDDSPTNRQRFLDAQGWTYFQQCWKVRQIVSSLFTLISYTKIKYLIFNDHYFV